MKNRNIKLAILIIGILLLVLFYGVQSRSMQSINGETHSFISIYLDAFQRYLFVGTFIVNIIIACTYIPYLNSLIKFRMKNNVFYTIWKKYLLIIFLFTIYILFCFFITSVLCNYNNAISIFNLNIFFRLFMFILTNFVVYNVAYLKTEKVFIGIAINIGINFLILITGIAYQYHIANNAMTEIQMMSILNVYTISVNIIGMIYLYMKTDKKECLK